MDYAFEALNFNMMVEYEETQSLVKQLSFEHSYLMNSMEAALVVMEAEGDAKPQSSDTKRNLMQKFIDFIKRMFSTFSEKMKRLANNNDVWLKNNAESLTSRNYSGVTIEMIPFWNIDIAAASNEVKRVYDTMSRIVAGGPNSDKYKDIDVMKRELFRRFLDEETSLTNGSKNYFRCGKSTNAAAKPVSVSGTQLQTHVVRDFIPYCQNYNRTTRSAIDALVKDATTKLNVINNKAKSVTESYLDNTIFLKEDLAFTSALFVMEAEGDEKPSATKVEVIDAGGKSSNTNSSNSSQTSDSQKSSNSGGGSSSSSELSVMRNYAQCTNVLMMSALTASEERYIAYINALRQLVAKPKGENKPKEEANPNEEKKSTPI